MFCAAGGRLAMRALACERLQRSRPPKSTIRVPLRGNVRRERFWASKSLKNFHLTAFGLHTQRNAAPMTSVTTVTQAQAAQLDIDLFAEEWMSDQLMELAGLSCAQAIHDTYPADKFGRVCVVVGPGNNGGDGLIMARHLKFFGHTVTIVYPKRRDKHPWTKLLALCQNMGLDTLSELPENLNKDFDLIVDSIFGYSFKGDIRAPFDTIVKTLKEATVPIASIDVPSGWEIDKGNTNDGINPEFLISLSVPKICANDFKGKYHFLGGRFVNEKIVKKYNLTLPEFPGSKQYVLLK